MKKRIFCLAFVLAVALMTTPALAVNCGNNVEEMPLEEPTVDWDTAAAIGYDFSVVGEDGVEPIPEPQEIRVSIVDLGQYQDGNLTYTVNGVEMVPLRMVAESMGYAVEWNEDTQSATVNGDGLTYTVRIGEDNVVDNATGNVISYADYDVLDITDEDIQTDTAAVFDYDMTVEKGIVGDMKSDDENSGYYADGLTYGVYSVNAADGENSGVAEIQSADGETYEIKYTTTENAEAADGDEVTYTITAADTPKAVLVNGMTYVPASMFSVMNYSYDAAENCFTLKIK